MAVCKAIINYNENDFLISNYPKIDELEEKIKKLNNKIDRQARDQFKKAWTGSRKGKRR